MVVFRYVQISQGRWGDASGLNLSDVLAEQLLRDSTFVRQYPTTAPNYRPNFYLGTVTDTERVPVLPKGYERYVINDDGTLGPRKRIGIREIDVPIIRCRTCDRTLFVQRLVDAVREWAWTLELVSDSKNTGQCAACQSKERE